MCNDVFDEFDDVFSLIIDVVDCDEFGYYLWYVYELE